MIGEVGDRCYLAAPSYIQYSQAATVDERYASQSCIFIVCDSNGVTPVPLRFEYARSDLYPRHLETST